MYIHKNFKYKSMGFEILKDESRSTVEDHPERREVFYQSEAEGVIPCLEGARSPPFWRYKQLKEFEEWISNWPVDLYLKLNKTRVV